MMPDTEAIKRRILTRAQEAKIYMDQILAEPHPSREFVIQHIRSYVLAKYMLGEDPGTDDFDELTDRSIANMMRLSPEILKDLEATRDCTGSTSATAKKVLLFLSIQKQLDILLPAMASAFLVTLEDLGVLVWEELEKKHEL